MLVNLYNRSTQDNRQQDQQFGYNVNAGFEILVLKTTLMEESS